MSRKNRTPADGDSDFNPPNDAEALETAPVLMIDKATEVAPTEKSLETPAEAAPNYIPLRVFATLAGPKWDQMAGFVSHARRLKLGPMTIEAWHVEFKKFQEKPIG